MKIKTKHIITCIKCLFLGLVMALPFIAVLPTALYYGFNDHAVSGDKVEYIPTNKVENVNDLVIGNEYYNNGQINDIMNIVNAYVSITNEDTSISFYGNMIELPTDYTIDDFYAAETDNKNEFVIWSEIVDIELGYINIFCNYIEKIAENENKEMCCISIDYSNSLYCIKTLILTEQIKQMIDYIYEYDENMIYIPEIINECPERYRTIVSIETNISNQNALEIAFNNVFNTKGFNWVTNSIIATPVYAFVGAFGLTSDLFLSNLIVYWTNILLIYGILNIVLVVFTKLTQLGKKKEED